MIGLIGLAPGVNNKHFLKKIRGFLGCLERKTFKNKEMGRRSKRYLISVANFKHGETKRIKIAEQAEPITLEDEHYNEPITLETR
jgi:hypothetical protein